MVSFLQHKLHVADMDSANPAFTELADSPNGVVSAGLINQQLVVARGNQIFWSHTDNIERWPDSEAPGTAGSFALRSGGRIIAVSATESNVFILCEKAIFRLLPVSAPPYYILREIAADVGCLSRGSVIRVPDDEVRSVLFLSDRGVMELQESGAMVNIGKDKVDRWFLQRINQDALEFASVKADTEIGVIYWALPSAGTDLLSLVLIYNYRDRIFSYAAGQNISRLIHITSSDDYITDAPDFTWRDQRITKDTTDSTDSATFAGLVTDLLSSISAPTDRSKIWQADPVGTARIFQDSDTPFEATIETNNFSIPALAGQAVDDKTQQWTFPQARALEQLTQGDACYFRQVLVRGVITPTLTRVQMHRDLETATANPDWGTAPYCARSPHSSSGAFSCHLPDGRLHPRSVYLSLRLSLKNWQEIIGASIEISPGARPAQAAQ